MWPALFACSFHCPFSRTPLVQWLQSGPFSPGLSTAEISKQILRDKLRCNCITSQAELKSWSQSFPALCDPMDCSPPGSSLHGIFRAWILEWVAISFSRGSSQPRHEYWSGLPFPSPGDLPDPRIKPGSPALWADALPSEPPGKPCHFPRNAIAAEGSGDHRPPRTPSLQHCSPIPGYEPI